MKKAIIGIIIAVAVIGGACYAFADSLANSSASGEVASTVGSAIYNNNTKPEAQANKTQQDVANNLDTSSSNSDVKSSVDSNSANNSKGSSNTTENTDSKKVTSIKTSNNNIENQGSLSFDLQGKNSNSNVKATPLTGAELSKFIGTWTVGQCVGYNGGGSAYGSEGIPNIPGKKIIIKENSIQIGEKEFSIKNYYMTKQPVGSGAYGHPGLIAQGGGKTLGVEDGYYTLLTPLTSSEDPSIASLNSGWGSADIGYPLLVVGDHLVIDDVGMLFNVTKDN